MNPPDLDLFYTDMKHIMIIKYIKFIDDCDLFREFMKNMICNNTILILNIDNLLPTRNNIFIFNKKWNQNYINFIEASANTKYRRDICYEDLLVLTLFYVLYNINLYENIIETIDLDIMCIGDIEMISFENNNLGQIYLSFYKQMKHCYNMPIKQIRKMLL